MTVSPLWENLKGLDTETLPEYPSFSPKLIQQLINLASQSTCNTSKHAAAILRTRKIPLSFGINSNYNGHAEQVAVKNAYSNIRNKRKKLNIIVIRVNKKGELTLSRPCTRCIINLRETEAIDKVFYSNVNGDIVMEKLSEMELLHYSRADAKLITK